MDSVLTLDDLRNWKRAEISLAVVGHPIAHSLSPEMHNAALRELSVSDPSYGTWHYHKFDIPPDQLGEALPIFHRHRFSGLNLTVPHKVLALGLIATIDPAAADIGAVNTLRWTAEGYEGFNTDGYGLEAALKETLKVELAGATVVLLGAGGAARGAAVACLRAGCARLCVGNRSADRLLALEQALRNRFPEAPLETFSPENPPAGLPDRTILVNATAAGLKPNDIAPISLAGFPDTTRVYDMIYNPPETDLLRTASARGMPCSNGLSMLIHQGARALELWTGRTVPVSAMRAAAENALSRQ